jgi:hypothetical protein
MITMTNIIATTVLLLLGFVSAQSAGSTGPVDLSVVTSNLSSWNQSDWSLTTNTYLPGQYQTRLSLGNGYVIGFASMMS